MRFVNNKTTNKGHGSTLGPTCNELKDANETTGCKWVLVAELFNVAVSDFDAKAGCSGLLVVTELLVSRTQCVETISQKRSTPPWCAYRPCVAILELGGGGWFHDGTNCLFAYYS